MVDLFKGVSFRRLVVMRDGVKQSAYEYVEHRNAVPDPDAHRIRTRAKPRFRFQRRSPQRQFSATELDRIVDYGLKQTKVDRSSGICFAVEADVVPNRRLTITNSRYKT